MSERSLGPGTTRHLAQQTVLDVSISESWSDRCATLKRVLYDVQRLVWEHYDVISRSAMQVYYSALPFTPTQTDLHRLFVDSNCERSLVRVTCGVKSHWDACLQTINLNNEIYSTSVSKDGSSIAAGDDGGQITIIDMVTGAVRHQLTGHQGGVNSVAFSPDGARVVSGSSDKTVRIWDSETGMQILKLEGHSSGVNSVAFSPDGARVVSGSDDDTVRIWDSETGMQMLKLEGHSSYVLSVAFSPDGARVVSGSYDDTVRIWDSETGMQLMKFARNMLYNTVEFTNNGKHISLLSQNMDKDSISIVDAETGIQLEDVDDTTMTSILGPLPQFQLDENRLTRLHPNGHRTTLCVLPPSYRIWTSCFHGAVGVLGLWSGEVVIIHMVA
jgi:WD40 repeat protein